MHPVTQVSQEDAAAYAAWRGARLPSAAEWEAAARLSAPRSVYAWGDTFAPGGGLQANVWTGAFPWRFSREGPPGVSQIGTYPPLPSGFVDLIGDVWEWTSSPFKARPECPCAPIGRDALMTLKGGSFLCAGEYCARYRPAALIGIARNAMAANIGFRCAWPRQREAKRRSGTARALP
jgi:formylglycine-generating enzyme required for sulfatase activity